MILMPIHVFIVEDHPIQRDTLIEYLGFSEGLELCGVASSGERALEKLEEVDPDVLVTDLALPGMSGLALVERVRGGRDLPCLVLSGNGDAHNVVRALEAGADGYVLKGRPKEVAAAIRAVARGERFLSPSLRDLPDGLG